MPLGKVCKQENGLSVVAGFVATVLNDKVYAENTLSNMTFPPDFLVAYHTAIASTYPGDIISTGTPRAVQINDGDTIECRIFRFLPLFNTVIDLKRTR